MELRVLKYFLAVAREGNITKAAETLNITQPTLSRQLMQLESQLDSKLFIRGKNKILLTDKGILLRRRAEEIIDLTEKTEKEFLQDDEVIAGEILIGSGEVNAMHSFAKFMKSFYDLYPQIQYNLYTGNADDIKEKIDKGLIDIGILIEPVDISRYDFIRLNKKETWGILMKNSDPLADKDYITANDLINKPIINTKRAVVQNEIFNWFGENYHKLKIVSTYNLIFNAAIMVEEGLGYAITLDKLVNSNDKKNLCFRPLFPKLETGTVVVWKKHQLFSLATTRFINKLKLYVESNYI